MSFGCDNEWCKRSPFVRVIYAAIADKCLAQMFMTIIVLQSFTTWYHKRWCTLLANDKGRKIILQTLQPPVDFESEHLVVDIFKRCLKPYVTIY